MADNVLYSSYYGAALNILRNCETHELSICRTVLAIASAYDDAGDADLAVRKRSEADLLLARYRNIDDMAPAFDHHVSSYDRFIPVSCR
jgi:hypothetical protein